jgi:hypothetical protein
VILFSGMIAGDPWQGGATWAVLQYVLGLKRLGHDVLFVEPIKQQSIRPHGAALKQSDNAAYFRRVVEEFALTDRAALLMEGTKQTVGIAYDELLTMASGAEMLINVSGMLSDERIISRIARRVYLDLDPAFIQMWHAIQNIDMRFDAHNHFVTVGGAIGDEGCAIPTCGRQWIKTLQPVVLEHWPAVGLTEPPARDAWTTIGNWRGYGSIEHDGVMYGQKAHSLRKLIDLPKRTGEKIELALAIDAGEVKDLAALAENRWTLLDPRTVARTAADYRRFIQQSKGEFGVAKSGYVLSRSGWFSDRSACYLASARPVVAQDTGFSRLLPHGEGLMAFDDAQQAAEMMDVIARDYGRHCRAARALAEEYFDSDRVLMTLLDAVGRS